MNLIDGDFQHSNIFAPLPLFDEITYDGYLAANVRKYRAVREDTGCQVLVLNMIRKEEDIIWQAFQDLIKRSIQEAAYAVSGVYTFDLLTNNIFREVKTYQHTEVTALLINHARTMKPGEKRLVKYSSVYGILSKLNNVDWGKITFSSAVEVFKDKDCFLDLMLKNLIKNFEFAVEPGILMINDLSQKPVYNASDQTQEKRLRDLMAKQIPTTIDYPPEVYIRDENGLVELYSGLPSR
jgi:hypothetical protein